MAGGLGFEPRLAESESAVLPLDDPPNPLPLGVLRTPAGFAPSYFLALDLTRVARHEACRTQRPAQRLVILHQRARDAVTDRARLACDAATAYLHSDIELAEKLYHLERLAHDHTAGLAAEKLIERALIDGDEAGPGRHAHAGGRGLPATGAVVWSCGCHLLSSFDLKRLGLLRTVRMLCPCKD